MERAWSVHGAFTERARSDKPTVHGECTEHAHSVFALWTLLQFLMQAPCMPSARSVRAQCTEHDRSVQGACIEPTRILHRSGLCLLSRIFDIVSSRNKKTDIAKSQKDCPSAERSGDYNELCYPWLLSTDTTANSAHRSPSKGWCAWIRSTPELLCFTYRAVKGGKGENVE